jgi:polar amino acid transport system permease protein
MIHRFYSRSENLRNKCTICKYAIVKDSALVSILGVADITQIGKVYAISTFKYVESYNIVALLYLTLTISLSLGVKLIEKRMSNNKKTFNHH